MYNLSLNLNNQSRSDDLLSQTQAKLERLSKLDSLSKPLAPPAPPSSVLVKPRPQPSPFPNTTTTTTTNTSALAINTNSINQSASLIDLKSSPSSSMQNHQLNDTVVINSTTTNNNNNNNNNTSQVDMLFDLSDSTLTLNTEPLKQGASYFDLIGLSSESNAAASSSSSNGLLMKTTHLVLSNDLADLLEPSSSSSFSVILNQQPETNDVKY